MANDPKADAIRDHTVNDRGSHWQNENLGGRLAEAGIPLSSFSTGDHHQDTYVRQGYENAGGDPNS